MTQGVMKVSWGSRGRVFIAHLAHKYPHDDRQKRTTVDTWKQLWLVSRILSVRDLRSQ